MVLETLCEAISSRTALNIRYLGDNPDPEFEAPRVISPIEVVKKVSGEDGSTSYKLFCYQHGGYSASRSVNDPHCFELAFIEVIGSAEVEWTTGDKELINTRCQGESLCL